MLLVWLAQPFGCADDAESQPADMDRKFTNVKGLALASLAYFLTACSPDNRSADIKRCITSVQQQAMRGSLTNLTRTDSAEDLHDKIGAAVSDCMSNGGYSHANADMADGRCLDDVDFNPYCYRRSK
jgi:hypothetical protein